MSSADSIIQVGHAFRLLFQDDLLNARALLLEKQSVQPYNHLGLAIIIFVEALLGMEENVIANALEALLKSEQAIKQAKNSLNSTSTSQTLSANHWWSPGLEYDIMLADVLIFQAILHFMTETISDSMKGIYKLTKAHKTYSTSHELIFSKLDETKAVEEPVGSSGQAQQTNDDDLKEDIDELIKKIQDFYSKPKKQPLTSSINSTTSYLTSSFNFFGFSSNRRKTTNSTDHPMHTEVSSITYKKWTEDPIASLVIGGSTFGFGLFGLILSFLPPKVSKLLSWVGLNNNSTSPNGSNNIVNQNLTQRNQSIQWLLFSNSSSPWELHAKLAGLSLITYRSAMLKAVGWLADSKQAIQEYKRLLDSIAGNKGNQSTTVTSEETRNSKVEENGTIWTIHKSRLLILEGDIKSSKSLIVKKLEQIQKIDNLDKKKHTQETAPQSIRFIGLLVYELALISVRLADWFKAGDAFLSLKEHNAWSHVTYQFAALGCFLLVKDKSKELKNKIDNLFQELPNLFSKKRSMGREMPPHEMLVTRKLNEYKSKHADLVTKGSIRPDRVNCYWDSILISPIEELSLMLMIYDDTPKRRLISGIQRLSSLNPKVSIDLSQSIEKDNHQEDPTIDNQQVNNLSHLESMGIDDGQSINLSLSRDEMVMRDLLLGVQLMNLGEYDESRVFLNKVSKPNASQQQQQQQTTTEKEKEAEEKRDKKGDYHNYVNALMYKSLIELKELDFILSESESLPNHPQPQPQDQSLIKPSREEGKIIGIHHQEGEVEKSNDLVRLCLSKLSVADSILDSILELQEGYHMRSRTESKIQLIKEQIKEKILKLSF